MNDGMKAEDKTQDIGGLELLGRGLNRLDWTSATKKSQKVCDTNSNPKSVTVNGEQRRMGANVAYFPEHSDSSFDETFSSSEQYHQRIEIKAEASVKYGAFSGGFTSTFGRSIDTLKERSGALHSQAVHLWELAIPIGQESTTTEFRKELEALPAAFEPAHPEAFFRFFGLFGTDIVHEVVVGGTLNYALLIDKSHVSESQKIEAMVKAEYGAFFSAKVDLRAEEECRKKSEHLSRKIRAIGGDHPLQFDEAAPQNSHKQFNLWRDSLPNSPSVVSVELVPIFQFVSDEGKRKTIEQAYQWCRSDLVTVDAHWSDSVVVVGKSTVPTSAADGARPALRLVFVDSATHACSATTYPAPAPSAPEHEFATFWKTVTQALNTGDGLKRRILLCTENWPRHPRYVPSPALRAELQRRGAHSEVFERWDRMTKNMHPCLIAGVTYVMVENSTTQKGNDGLAFGFGKRGQKPAPSVKVRARLSLDSSGKLQFSTDEPAREDSNTTLYVIKNTKDDHDALSFAQQDNTMPEMKKTGTPGLEHVWYLHALDKRNVDPYKAINAPHILINYETCGVLQGDHKQGICRLMPLGEQYQDDIIWDVRSDGDQFHFPLVHFLHDALNLTQVGRHVSVRVWAKAPYMHWTREQWRG